MPWEEATSSLLTSLLLLFLIDITWIISRYQYTQFKDYISQISFLQGLADEKKAKVIGQGL